jgi:hypothetical protein
LCIPFIENSSLGTRAKAEQLPAYIYLPVYTIIYILPLFLLSEKRLTVIHDKFLITEALSKIVAILLCKPINADRYRIAIAAPIYYYYRIVITRSYHGCLCKNERTEYRPSQAAC